MSKIENSRSLADVETSLARTAKYNRFAEKMGYYIMTASCVFMVGWVTNFPASWRTGTEGEGLKHAQYVDAAFVDMLKSDTTAGVVFQDYVDPLLRANESETTSNATLRSMFTAAAPHPAIRYSHNLAALPWSLIAPLQFSSRVRKSYTRLHRWLGRAFLLTSISLMFGFALIQIRRLGYIHHSRDHILYFPAAVFTISGVMAYWAIAMNRDIEGHRRWIMRHVASGVWVSVMRMSTAPALGAVMHKYMQVTGVTELLGPVKAGRLIFGATGLFTIFACMGLTEVYLYNLRREQQLQKERRMLKRSKKE